MMGGFPSRLTDANTQIPHVSAWIPVVERFAELTVAAHGVMLTFVTHSSAGVSRGQIDGHVKVALLRMLIAVTLWKKTNSQDVVEVLLRCQSCGAPSGTFS